MTEQIIKLHTLDL